MKFNEDSRVKIPALLHLMRLGYNYIPFSQQIGVETEPTTCPNTRLVTANANERQVTVGEVEERMAMVAEGLIIIPRANNLNYAVFRRKYR